MRDNPSFGTPWILLCAALAVHVYDEATNNFLGFYNPMVHEIRGRFTWLPIPTFTFSTWLTLLIIAIVCLLALSFFAYRGNRWLRPFAYFYSIAMMANGAGHVLASLQLRYFAPGVYSSPLLLAASAYLFVTLRKTGSDHSDHVTHQP